MSFQKKLGIKNIDFIDIGCSGDLSTKWSELFPILNYVGFDPNKDECLRLEKEDNDYKSIKFFPYAVAGENGFKTLYKTKSIYCYSLLKPNHKWLNRFHYHNLFKETGTGEVKCSTLNRLASAESLRADIVKMDTQGLELPILKASENLLKNVICIESETGFLDNYLEETTFSQVDGFLRPRGYLMLDIKIHTIGRDNQFKDEGKHQPLWCEAVWLFDYVGRDKSCEREEALKAIAICRTLKLYDYGYELSEYFKTKNIINEQDYRYLAIKENWLKQTWFMKVSKFIPLRIKKKLKCYIRGFID